MILAKGQFPRNLTTKKIFVIIKPLKEKTKGETNMTEKNKKKQKAKESRVQVLFNTGTRDMKSEKDYNRQKLKQEVKKMGGRPLIWRFSCGRPLAAAETFFSRSGTLHKK